MIIIDGLLLVLLMIGWYLEKFLKEKEWSNPFLNTFYIFNMIFSSPFSVMFAIYTLHLLFENKIFEIFEKFSIIYLGLTNISTISLFLVLNIACSLLIYFVWTFIKNVSINYQSLLDFSKIFIFQAPLLLIVYGFFVDSTTAGTEWTIPFLSYWIMINGLYVVPLFMIAKEKMKSQKINFRRE